MIEEFSRMATKLQLAKVELERLEKRYKEREDPCEDITDQAFLDLRNIADDENDISDDKLKRIIYWCIRQLLKENK